MHHLRILALLSLHTMPCIEQPWHHPRLASKHFMQQQIPLSALRIAQTANSDCLKSHGGLKRLKLHAELRGPYCTAWCVGKQLEINITGIHGCTISDTNALGLLLLLLLLLVNRTMMMTGCLMSTWPARPDAAGKSRWAFMALFRTHPFGGC